MRLSCGVKFCGGCNPRFARGEAYQRIKEALTDKIDFVYAEEGGQYDILLVVCGCTNCCASILEYQFRLGCVKMWDESHITKVTDELTTIYLEWSEEGKE